MTKIRKGYSSPLFSQPIRSFNTLAEASYFIDRLIASNRQDYRFNIIQQRERWTVCKVLAGQAPSQHFISRMPKSLG